MASELTDRQLAIFRERARRGAMMRDVREAHIAGAPILADYIAMLDEIDRLRAEVDARDRALVSQDAALRVLEPERGDHE